MKLGSDYFVCLAEIAGFCNSSDRQKHKRANKKQNKTYDGVPHIQSVISEKSDYFFTAGKSGSYHRSRYVCGYF